MTVRHVIIGAGAVGGTVAALLAESGRPVLVLARGPHAAVMRGEGLELTLPGRNTLVRLGVVETVESLAPRRDDVLHLCTKSQHAEPLVQALAARPVAGRTAAEVLPLLCVQNGVANEPRALRYFQNVLGVCVALPARHRRGGRGGVRRPHRGGDRRRPAPGRDGLEADQAAEQPGQRSGGAVRAPG